VPAVCASKLVCMLLTSERSLRVAPAGPNGSELVASLTCKHACGISENLAQFTLGLLAVSMLLAVIHGA